jgi:alkaline phosphatase
MNKSGFLALFLSGLYFTASAQKAEFVPPKDVPRNIIIIMASGMGMNQIAAATLKKGNMLSFSKFPVMGLVQPWQSNEDMPTDSITATAIATNRAQNGASGFTSIAANSKNIFAWAKEKQMKTGLITTGSVTAPTPRIFAIDKPDNKDNEAIALEYLNADLDILMGGGSRFFVKRYDGQNLFQNFKKKGYKIETNIRNVGDAMVQKTVALVSKDELYRASERKDYLHKATFSAVRSMTTANGYLLVVENTKIKEADSLNDIKLLDEEILDIDKLTEDLTKELGAGTLILVIGNYEYGGLTLKNSTISKKTEPDVSWQGRKPTAALTPVFATGPGADQFSGMYTLPDIYSKLENMMVKRR